VVSGEEPRTSNQELRT